MPSNPSGPGYPGNNGLPPELDPRRGRPRTGANQQPGGLGALPPELDPRGRRSAGSGRPPRSRRAGSDLVHGVALGGRVVATLLSLAVLLGSGFAWATYRNFSASITRVNAISAKGKAKSGGIDGKDQNILIVGNDDRDTATDAELKQLGTTRDGGTYNTDTMMLLHLPADGSKATAISFPRDSYVDIPGHGKNKLNSAYPDGVLDGKGDKAAGARLLVTTIENLTGLSVDHFVQVDLIGFYRISNAIGGVDVCLNAAQKEANSGIDLKAGHQLIMGTQALAFVRQRYGLPGGDLDRIKRQQYFLSAVFRKITSAGTLLNPLKLNDLLKAVSSSLQMDNSLDPAKLAQQMQGLQAGKFTFTTIPTKGTEDTDVGNVVVVDTAAIPDFVDNLIGTDAAAALKNATAASPGSVTVAVVNDTDSNGLETANASALQAAGFKTTLPAATSDVIAKTTISYPPGQEAAAKALQAQVPGAVMQRSRQVSGVTLLLGNNKVQVSSLMPKTTTKAPTTAAPATSAPTTGGTVTTTAADAGCIN